MDNETRIKAEAAAFRGLVEHLQARKDVQNIDLMNLAGFCRNCLAKWYMAAANELGEDMDYDAAREAIYGMTYDEWKKNHQTKATAEQLQLFEDSKPLHAKISGH
ncbi:MAG: alkaline phosphatase [Proteobacteria bacterium]|nr:MAG: alkaline phosphatase [Pseudomonadota bacterium]